MKVTGEEIAKVQRHSKAKIESKQLSEFQLITLYWVSVLQALAKENLAKVF